MINYIKTIKDYICIFLGIPINLKIDRVKNIRYTKKEVESSRKIMAKTQLTMEMEHELEQEIIEFEKKEAASKKPQILINFLSSKLKEKLKKNLTEELDKISINDIYDVFSFTLVNENDEEIDVNILKWNTFPQFDNLNDLNAFIDKNIFFTRGGNNINSFINFMLVLPIILLILPVLCIIYLYFAIKKIYSGLNKAEEIFLINLENLDVFSEQEINCIKDAFKNSK